MYVFQKLIKISNTVGRFTRGKILNVCEGRYPKNKILKKSFTIFTSLLILRTHAEITAIS